MKFAYEDLSPTQFETLIVFLCQRLLGIAVQGFSTGPDGGRDAKFVGTAELHPSKASPWCGTTIIQAKHTNGLGKRFSDSDFFVDGSDTTVIGKEIPRIKNLRGRGELDNYMLFANRRLAGEAESTIRKYISQHCSIPEASLYLCGAEHLETLLKRFPEVAKDAALDPVDSPLMVGPDELAELVEAFARFRQEIRAALESPPVPRVPYGVKNQINQMDADYAKEQRKRYLKDTAPIQAFLAAPENAELCELYESIVEEFQLKILSKRKDYQGFEEVLEYLTELLFARDPILRSKKRLTRAMLFYMYWHCDIGATDDAPPA